MTGSYDKIDTRNNALIMSDKESDVNLSFYDESQINSEKEPVQATIEFLIFQLHAAWKQTFKTRDAVRSEEERSLWGKAAGPLRRLVERALPRDDEADVLKKMVDLCILLSGLGSATADNVVKETYPALLSVMKSGDVARFVDLPQEERKEHLLELVQIVMGIRLFNKDCRKGGAGVEDLPNVLSRASKTTSYRLDIDLTSALTRCSLYTACLSKVYYLDKSDIHSELKAFVPPHLTADDVETVKAALCFCRLHHNCLSKVYSELRDSELHVRTCVEQLRATLLQLHGTVRYKSAIPTIQVYPLFVQLSVIWRELQQETAMMTHVNTLLDLVKDIAVKLEEPALVKFFKRNLTPEMSESLTLDGLKTLKLKGFCPWTLIQTCGGLLPGTHVIEGHAFRSPAAANCWLRDVSGARAALHSVLSSRPYLHLYLGLPWRSQLDSPAQEDAGARVVATEECGVQTEVHPVSSHVDRDYAWSVWEMKRRALQLARLVNCKTTSQQTDVSAFRKSTAVQTTRDRAVNAVPSCYLMSRNIF